MRLFEPLKLKNGVVIKNRFMKAAMSEIMGDHSHRPTPKLINLYKNWADGGVGLMITGNVMIDSRALGEIGNIVIENHHNLSLLKQWAMSGNSNGAQTWVQLNHPGRQSPKIVSKQPLAPSAVPLEGPNAFAFNPPRAMTISEIHNVIGRFARSALIVKEAGFAGVEIHAAHGYLLDQFLSPRTNRRNDQYGGSLENRMRIIGEIYFAIRKKVGSNFPVAIKINSEDYQAGGFSESDSLKVIQRLSEYGIDLIEISGGDYESPAMESTSSGPFFIDYAKKAKQLVSAPLSLTGGFRTVSGMEKALENSETEMIGLARPFALNPKLPNQIKNGKIKNINVEHLSTGINMLDKKMGSYIGLSYYEMLMNRIAKNKVIKPTKNAWIPLAFALRTQGISSFLPNRG